MSGMEPGGGFGKYKANRMTLIIAAGVIVCMVLFNRALKNEETHHQHHKAISPDTARKIKRMIKRRQKHIREGIAQRTIESYTYALAQARDGLQELDTLISIYLPEDLAVATHLDIPSIATTMETQAEKLMREINSTKEMM